MLKITYADARYVGIRIQGVRRLRAIILAPVFAHAGCAEVSSWSGWSLGSIPKYMPYWLYIVHSNIPVLTLVVPYTTIVRGGWNLNQCTEVPTPVPIYHYC